MLTRYAGVRQASWYVLVVVGCSFCCLIILCNMNSVMALKLGVGDVNLKSVTSKISARSYQPIYLICGFNSNKISVLTYSKIPYISLAHLSDVFLFALSSAVPEVQCHLCFAFSLLGCVHLCGSQIYVIVKSQHMLTTTSANK